MKRLFLAGTLLASSAFAQAVPVPPQAKTAIVIPAPIGVQVAGKDATYMLVVQNGAELSKFLPLPPAQANSDIVQVFVNTTDPSATNFLARVVVLSEAGNVSVLSQLVKRAPAGDTLASFLVPLNSTVLYVSAEGINPQF
jgi:hypothetical protein